MPDWIAPFASAAVSPRPSAWGPARDWLFFGPDILLALCYVSIPVSILLALRKVTKIRLAWLPASTALFLLLAGLAHGLTPLAAAAPSGFPATLAAIVKVLCAVTGLALAASLPRRARGVLALLESAGSAREREVELERAHDSLAEARAEIHVLRRHAEASDAAYAAESARAARALADLRAAETSPRSSRGASPSTFSTPDASTPEARETFLLMVSRELRSPLSVILGWISLLRTGSYPEERLPEVLAKMERQGQRLLDLVGLLGDASLIARGGMRLVEESVELDALVETLVRREAEGAKARGQILEWHLPDAPGLVWGDPERLTRVLTELLGNAFKFTPREGRVRLSLTRRGDLLVLRIEDTGPGMAPEHIARVREEALSFEVEPPSRAGSGVGLGLKVAKALIEKHGGTLDFVEPGVGFATAVEVVLPLQATGLPPQIPAPAPRAMAPTLPLVRDLPGVRVLFVGPENPSVDHHCAVLASHGADIERCENTIEVGRALRTRRFDVVVTDTGKPLEEEVVVLAHVEATRSQRTSSRARNAEPPPVIALTGPEITVASQVPRTVPRFARRRFHEVLVAPVAAEALVASVRRAISTRETRT